MLRRLLRRYERPTRDQVLKKIAIVTDLSAGP
jgi:hypothetical protein